MIVTLTNLETKLVIFAGAVILKDYALYRYGYHKGYLNGFDTGQRLSRVDEELAKANTLMDVIDDVTAVVKRMNERSNNRA